MFERLLGSVTGTIGAYLSKKIEEHRDLYSEEQLRILREMEDEEYQLRILREMEDEEYSSSMSWFSSSASSTTDDDDDDIGTPYFESLEKRLGMEEEFFKKEEFDVE